MIPFEGGCDKDVAGVGEAWAAVTGDMPDVSTDAEQEAEVEGAEGAEEGAIEFWVTLLAAASVRIICATTDRLAGTWVWL